MSEKITSETLEQAVARTGAAHMAARKSGQVVPAHITKAATDARLALHRQEMGPELFDARRAWATGMIESRAKRLVSFGHEDKTGHGPSAVVSAAQFEELRTTGTIKGGPVDERATPARFPGI